MNWGSPPSPVFAEEDKLALHRFKADEAYQVGKGLGPIEAYLSIPEIIRVAKLSGADAIHPGYGFLSESPEFADACREAGITFVGPSSDTMRRLGNKVAGAQSRHLGRRPRHAGDRTAARRHGGGEEGRPRDRLPGDAQGVVGRRRTRHGASSATRPS